ncbi:MAG: CpaD family pilus assembly lipoprotein [Geminicoccaceae bacterium]
MPAPRRFPSCCLLVLAAAIGACSPIEPPPVAAALPQPVASPVELEHTVRFEPRSARLAPDELAALATFAANLPAGIPPQATLGQTAQGGTAAQRLDAQRRAQILAVLTRERPWFPAAGPAAQVTLADGSGGHDADRLVVRATTFTVALPGCPDWTRDPTRDGNNLMLSNLGCANAVNLGLMVADPADLWLGRPLGPADGIQQADAVTRYRTDKVRPLAAEDLQP